MTIESIEQQINSADAILLYFSGENCGVCQALMPKIKTAFTNNFPQIKQLYISASEYPSIATHFGVFTIPTILVFFEGKETRRESRHISVDSLIKSTERPYKLFFDERIS